MGGMLAEKPLTPEFATLFVRVLGLPFLQNPHPPGASIIEKYFLGVRQHSPGGVEHPKN